ncbi:HD domain-containing protein [Patescibacteria group bacterium]|nr:HD domain-containing protein [Patescibacteria group bacterium]
MNLTDIKDIYEKYNVPSNIVAHMRMVAAVALFLAETINQKAGQPVVGEKTVTYAALLHDLMRVSGRGHEDLAAAILIERGEKELATIISKTRFICIISARENERPQTLEEKIVYYADKRVMNDQIVSIEKRLEEGGKNYNRGADAEKNRNLSEKAAIAIAKLQKELCDLVGFHPDDINERTVAQFYDRFQDGPLQ